MIELLVYVTWEFLNVFKHFLKETLDSLKHLVFNQIFPLCFFLPFFNDFFVNGEIFDTFI